MWFWEWECCDNKWQLIPSKRYPERNEFAPRCPTCNRQLKRKDRQWMKKVHSGQSPLFVPVRVKDTTIKAGV